MRDLIERIKRRLSEGAFASEAAVSHGIVIPVLQALGWDPAEPDQIIPEFTSGRGRVDFALCSSPRRPAIFIEVKGVGRSTDADKQLFEYAFHEGVPLCVLTDGREWSFYLPSGQGNYQDRRVYRLNLEDRGPEETERVLHRYLESARVRSGAAREAADADYRDQAARREAARVLPQAWSQLVSAPEELLVELVSEQVEAICGYPPPQADVLSFLRSLNGPSGQGGGSSSSMSRGSSSNDAAVRTRPQPASDAVAETRAGRSEAPARGNRRLVLFGEARSTTDAMDALVQVLTELSKRNPALLPRLAAAARGRTRNHIAQSVEEIYPSRPELASAVEFSPGWLVGKNIANREKLRIAKRACEVYGLRFGTDIQLELPNT